MTGTRLARALVLSVVSLLPVIAAGETETRPPNVLLVTIDTQRADALGLYGNRPGLTPHIDALGARSTVFERATSPVGTTFPAHASLLTGVYPRTHGVRYNGDSLDDGFVTLAEALSGAGYDTMAFLTYGSMISRGGLGQGFAEASHEPGGPPAHSEDPEKITGLVEAALAKRRSRPFLLWAHYYQPHSPYDPTPFSKKALTDYDGPLKDGVAVSGIYKLQGQGTPLSDSDHEALRALYDGETQVADETLGRILQALEKAGLEKDTIVVVTSDHGEVLGEHGDFGHGPRLWEEVLRVPLVIHDPRDPTARRVRTRVGLVDVAPTLLDLVGVAIPDGTEGRSLAPALRGEPLDDIPYYGQVAALSPWQQKKNPKQARDEGAIAVYSGHDKLIIQDGRTSLYDLGKDPKEESPRTDDASATRRKELEDLARAYPNPAASTTGQVDPGELSPKVVDELKALGYLR